jgi:hypothetical protein
MQVAQLAAARACCSWGRQGPASRIWCCACARTVFLSWLVRLGAEGERLPAPARDAALDLPVLRLDAARAGAADRIVLALDCALGEVASLAGAFAAP